MSEKKWVRRGIGLGAVALAVLLFACHGDFQPTERDGRAAVSIAVADASTRTVFPGVSLSDVASYILRGGRSGATEAEIAALAPGETSVFLEPGTWNFTLNAYNTGGSLILQGIVQNQAITLAGPNQITFNLFTLNSGTGAIQITISFPVTAGVTRITASGDIAAEEFPVTTGAGQFTYTKTGIAAGDHFVSFRLFSADTLKAVVSELVLVRGNVTSTKTIALARADLKPEPENGETITVSNTAGFASALSAIQNSAEDNFTVIVTADMSLGPQDLTLAAYADKSITLRGNTPARTVSLSGQGSLFTVGADVELVLEDIVLAGISDNNTSLVTVNTDGKLVLNNGGKVTGNTYNTSVNETGGGGVYVDGGTLEIAGGEVSGNTINSTARGVRGGGVYAVNDSDVLMTDGAIRDNIITSVYSGSGDSGPNGGGVFLSANSSFEMTGGVIEGNEFNHRSTILGAFGGGGGVNVSDTSSFYFKGGTIRNNAIHAQSPNNYGITGGGGVAVAGVFVMSGGIISGNRVTHSINPNKYYGSVNQYYDGAYGGGVSGSIVKTGGIIYGSEAVGNDGDGIPLKNTAQNDGSGLGGGHAVFYDTGNRSVGGTQLPRRNTTVGETDNLYSNGSTLVDGMANMVMVTFDINGGTGTTPATRAAISGSTVTLPGGDRFSRSGYTFDGWNTNPSGTGANYNAGSSYTGTGEVTLYARWVAGVGVTVAMWDSRSDGWDTNAALRINVNGTDISPNARLGSGGGPEYHMFIVNPGDVVRFYWVNGGTYDYECAFAVYYTAASPNPAFNPSSGTTDSSRVLISKQYSSSGSVGNGTLMGSFTVP